jgi:hypothetical protein
MLARVEASASSRVGEFTWVHLRRDLAQQREIRLVTGESVGSPALITFHPTATDNGHMNANTEATTGHELRDLRRARGLSQQALATRADCSISMVALLESGYRHAGESTVLARIESILGDKVASGASRHG